ncbi:SpaH/EbpB family LPXTG-anchored major pilin [Corynebacterium propinquum]|uniref:SpaH/EbpB family LPXTG-anchored major pilin n=1 Tax=Corynebacterium propinquum TaxID=43769 RepID=UPI0025408324|nr:SpaH/EbpB family LPXTG-anchored major pilin [Corynebacterium propinquum]MDK4235264.1 SpaH/EbpB family LPXTG-anchored major pilin [Corynebacterium propinquum]MDK4303974.1 SpaH/EbpB family LPXTG-anchored major pilin [Corynebacterium propinquum]WKS34722.1 SpaH/EbpB family LPXTG-anchored major pilin [Corynebacterium propinquum]WKS41200.1 SpaH/EbpB family LPXTG-anchored major pilin [Corynebacterium propinquum]
MAKTISKPIALAIAAGITLGGAFGAGSPAFAQDGTVPSVAEEATQVLPHASLIPDTDDFSLTLHKRLNPKIEGDATGNPDSRVSGEPLDGAHFELQKLEGNIREQAGLTHLAEVADEFNRAKGSWRGNGGLTTPPLDENFTPRTGVTGQDGVAGELKFDNLTPGAYLVTETQTPAPQGAEGFVKSKPYIVLVPTVNKEGTDWEKHVHSYPKNSSAKVAKEVFDENKHALDDFRDPQSAQVGYGLTAHVPNVPAGDFLTEFVVQDSYNNEELGIDADLKPRVFRIPGGNGRLQPLDPSSYEVQTQQPVTTNTQNLPADANESFKIAIDTDTAGLESGDSVYVAYQATLLKAKDQDIENAVSSFGMIASNTGTQRFETPNDKVVTYIGDVQIHKVDQSNNERFLEGADFDLFRCDAPDEIIQSGTTDKDGRLTFSGIHVSDWVYNQAPQKNVEYCLQETDAPSGYLQTREEPYRFYLNVNSREFVEGGQNGETIRRVSMTIENIPDTDRPLLPKTGGMGILLVALLGLGIIGGGVYAARRNSAIA